MRDNTIYDEMPDGWKITPSTICPKGYKWINNGKSRFSKEYRYALLREKKTMDA